MPEVHQTFELSSLGADIPAPVLVGVQARGRLDAALFELTLRQTYRNTSDRVLEVVYTFPLPPRAVLLGFASELNGARQMGVVTAREAAEQQYESALALGDAPVMLEEQPMGLHSANIGNLKPGDEIVLECRLAQLLAFEDGRLRLSIPTTIGPRYGDAQQAGLQPQHVPRYSLAVEYPLELTLTLGEVFAGARAESPTHRFALTRDERGLTCLSLQPGARLDRDVVVLVQPRDAWPSLLVRARDEAEPSAPAAMLAALRMPPAAPSEPVDLKVLVDCSGSMAGDGIASARVALHGIVDGLSETDRCGLARFGDKVEFLVEPVACRAQVRRHLRTLIDGMQADLGGTEIARAMRHIFGWPSHEEPRPGELLLITDGLVWDIEQLSAFARHAGARIFVIGVGSAPSEAALRALTEPTGGAFELVTPGEALVAAAQRMLHRMRQPRLRRVWVDWGTPPAWACEHRTAWFGGDTVIALAGFATAPMPGAIRLLAEDAQGRIRELARCEADAPCPGNALPRIAASHRLSSMSGSQALDLALRHQLLSPQTQCVLVHRREEAERAAQQAQMHRVPSMPAAGWGGLGVAFCAQSSDQNLPYEDAPAGLCGAPILHERDVRPKPSLPLQAVELRQRVLDHLMRGEPANRLPAHVQHLLDGTDLGLAIQEVMRLGFAMGEACAIFADWFQGRSPNRLPDAMASRGLIRGLDPDRVQAAHRVLDARLEELTKGRGEPVQL